MVPQWQRAEPLVGPGGDCGGDIQAGDAYNARWLQPRADGGTAMVTRSYYVADNDEATYLECQTEYLVCSDPDDPGGTEVWADYRYRELQDGPAQPNDDDAWLAALGAVEPTTDEWSTLASPYDEDGM